MSAPAYFLCTSTHAFPQNFANQRHMYKVDVYARVLRMYMVRLSFWEMCLSSNERTTRNDTTVTNFLQNSTTFFRRQVNAQHATTKQEHLRPRR